MAKSNILTRSKKTKANALLSNGQLLEADKLFASICQTSPSDVESLVMRAIIHRKLGLFREAETLCRQALKLKPNYAWGHQVLGTALQCLGDIKQAIAHYQRAIQYDPGLAESHYLLGNALSETGSFHEAAECYRSAIQVRPDYLEALSNLGAALIAMDELLEANDVLTRVSALVPNSPQVLCNLGAVRLRTGQLKEALDKYQRALIINPESPEAISNSAILLEKMHRLDEAQEIVDRKLPRMSDNAMLVLAAARLERRKGNFQKAVTLLEKVSGQTLDGAMAGDIQTQLGLLYDRLGEVDRAYACFSEGNRLTAQSSVPVNESRYDYLQTIDRMGDYLTEGLGKLHPETSGSETSRDPVFLFGFPRSGTTLLGQILDSHPDLQTLEEKDTVAKMVQEFEEIAGGRENAIENLFPEEIARLRKVYYDRADSHLTRRPGAILVDKMPLNTIHAHIIWRVFPKSKFILAIRHPCDACLSCFMQSFVINESNACFFSLEDTARVYSKVMRLWQRSSSILPFSYHLTRYEDLVSNFEHETQTLLNFIGVGWNDSVMKHNEHARKNRISTPSYHQVTQPIYQHAKYRWRRYARQFETVLPMLRPFIEYFGYSDTMESKE
jgi:tetratricopeptide (TPR) repeat protein